VSLAMRRPSRGQGHLGRLQILEPYFGDDWHIVLSCCNGMPGFVFSANDEVQVSIFASLVHRVTPQPSFAYQTCVLEDPRRGTVADVAHG
jgi:hypothetical protein